MPRAVYGVDPEMLGLSGPNAFAQAFRSSLDGLTLGNRLATTALDRELARENARNIQQDRLTQATPGQGAGGVSGGGRSAGSGGSGSVPVGGGFSEFLRRQAGNVAPSAEAQRMSDFIVGNRGGLSEAEVRANMENMLGDGHWGDADAAAVRRQVNYGLTGVDGPSLTPVGDTETIWGDKFTKQTPAVRNLSRFILTNTNGLSDDEIRSRTEEILSDGRLSPQEQDLVRRVVNFNLAGGDHLSEMESAGTSPEEVNIISRVRQGVLSEEDARRLLAEVRSMEGVNPTLQTDVPVENPLVSVGFRPDYAPTPQEASMLLRRRAKELGKSPAEAAALVQQYENFYTQRMGQYENHMAGLMQRAADEEQARAAAQDALLQQGAEAVIGDRYGVRKVSDTDLASMASFLRNDQQAFAVPSGQAADTQQSRIAATPGTIRANTDRSVVERDSRLLAQMRKSIYETAYDNAIANGSTQEEADAIATRERDQVIDPVSARQYFNPPSASDAPPLSESEVAYLLRAEDEAGGKPVKSDDEYAMRARAVMGNPSQLARLAAGKSATGTLLEKFMVDRFGVGQKQPVKPGEADQTLEL
jgi:hypothetical protein